MIINRIRYNNISIKGLCKIIVFVLSIFLVSCDDQQTKQNKLEFLTFPSFETKIPINPFIPSKNKGNNAAGYLKKNKRFGLDSQNILTMNYGAAYGNAGIKYNPTFIATYASAFYQDYIDTSDVQFKKGLTTQVDWLLERKTVLSYNEMEFWIWAFDFDLENYHIKAPWWSGLSQGRILSAVLAAYETTKDPKYLDAIAYIFRPFLIPTHEGGLATQTSKGVWYEEYINKDAQSTKILNGHISALASLWTLWYASKNKSVKNALELGIDAVVNNLDKFDSGATGILSLNPYQKSHLIGRLGYNTFHIYQLLWLYEVRPDPVILKHALNYSRYDYPDYIYSVLGSTDPIKHGPENLNYEGYPKHWSHNQFPTWVEVDMGFVDVIYNIMIIAHSLKSTPKDFIVQSSIDGQNWKEIGEFKNNSTKDFQIDFSPILARYVRIIIMADNGKNNVSLNGIVIWQKYGTFSAIANFHNFSSGNSPRRMFDKKWKPSQSGWFILDLVNPSSNEVLLQIDSASDADIQFFQSSDLVKFHPATPNAIKQLDKSKVYTIMVKNRYLKCQFDKDNLTFILKKIKAGNFRTWKSAS